MKASLADESCAIRGRVHAVVRRYSINQREMLFLLQHITLVVTSYRFGKALIGHASSTLGPLNAPPLGSRRVMVTARPSRKVNTILTAQDAIVKLCSSRYSSGSGVSPSA